MKDIAVTVAVAGLTVVASIGVGGLLGLIAAVAYKTFNALV